jgi:hypothetical protein
VTDDVTTGTTHDPQGGGGPRLIFALGGEAIASADGSVTQTEYALAPGRTSIGSAADADLRLPDLAPEHASIVRDEFDEYVLEPESPELPSRVNGQPVSRHSLRTGDRVELGPWTLTYFRDEYADHGRPFGGRQGGEGAVQQEQPPRSESTPAEEPSPADLRTVTAEGASEPTSVQADR